MVSYTLMSLSSSSSSSSSSSYVVMIISFGSFTPGDGHGAAAALGGILMLPESLDSSQLCIILIFLGYFRARDLLLGRRN